MLQQYTARELTYDSDALNAFSGIVRDFENSKSKIDQIYGIPFMPGDPEKARMSFLNGLTWFHSSESQNGNDPSRPRRRESFPSWSWAGWAGKVDFHVIYSVRGLPVDSFTIDSVYIHSTEQGTTFDTSSSLQEVRFQEGAGSSLPYLHFYAFMVPSSVFSYDGSTDPPCLKAGRLTARLCLSMSPWDPREFKESLEGGRRQCIHWGKWAMTDFVMVLQLESEGVWSKVGFIIIEDPKRSLYFEDVWSGVRHYGPERTKWLNERPSDDFRVV